ncbi:hypothetical protein BKM31_52585 [[Actinomadura] parvosata subsp. kistnae]|uniref:Bacterial Ig-like domain-containing protein n=1 Tax=[Actinomadura] parvosata subsp. kistnae TaxID=1909395 RepID=A0A1V0AFJ3_9ACTN|nr:hypothetical protein BKM31_52585 [Nonomuraea sp. ATCC 55076]
MITTLAPAAAADSTTDLGVSLSVTSKSGDVAVGGGKVFVSAENQIVVTDTAGVLSGAIAGLSGAQGLAMRPDGTRLYAALRGLNEVVEIDTATLAITRRIALPSNPCPSYLALSGDRLWVGYGCQHMYNGGVLGVDLSAAVPAPVEFGPNTSYAPILAAAGDTLVFGDPGVMPTDLLVYDVGGASPTSRGVISGSANGELSNLLDLAITGDGSKVVSSFGSPNRFDVWDTTSLTRTRTYGEESASHGSWRAVAISPDGEHVAGGSWRGSVDLTLFDTGTGATTYTTANPVGDVVQGSLAFSGDDVFSVLRASRDGRLHLWRAEDTTLSGSTLTLTPPDWSIVSKPLTMTGRLTLSGEPAPGPQQLVVTRRPDHGAATTLPAVTTAADGTFTFTDTSTAGGGTTWEVRWNGDSDHRAATASAFIWTRFPASLTLTGPAEGLVGSPLRLTGTLTTDGHAAAAGTWVSVQRTLTQDGNTVTTDLPGVATADDGSFAFTDTPAEAGRYRYVVQWGDTSFEPAEAGHEVTVQEDTGV